MERSLGKRLAGVAAAYAVTLVALSGCSLPGTPAAHGHEPTAASFDPRPADFAAVRQLLARRAHAAVVRDEAAFLATVDNRDGSFVAKERTLYQNLAQLPLSSLRYTTDMSALLVPADVGGGDPTLHPVVVEQLSIRGTTRAPISNSLDLTFVRRAGHWLVASESDVDTDSVGGASSDERPWWGGAILVRHDGALTVLVNRARSTSLRSLTSAVSRDIDADASLLGVPGEHALLVDATSNGKSTAFSTLSKEKAAAVTRWLEHTDASGNRYLSLAGMAIKIDPRRTAEFAGDQVVLRHELTHYLLRQYASSSPTWLSEGIADWVAFYPDESSPRARSSNLYLKVLHSSHELPTVGVFNYDPDVHYVVAQAAVAWLVDRGGMPKLMELMRDYHDDYQGTMVDDLTPELLRRVYGITQKQLVVGAFQRIARAY